MTQLAKQLIAQAKAEGWKRLDLGNCGLTDLETQVPELFDLTDLEELVLSNMWEERNESEKWSEAKRVIKYNYSENNRQANHLSQLSQAMAELKQLKVLVCGGDCEDHWAISDYSVIQHLPHLTRLDLKHNQITHIGNLDKLTNLQQLDLSYNKLTRIENLAELTNLQQLNLSKNQISDLSPLLPFLQRAKNPLQLVVKDGYAMRMGEINVKYNPLTTPPMEIVEQGTAAVLHYFKDYGKGAAANKEIKLIVVGNGCVGKTASVRRLVHNTYAHIDIATGRTHGIIIEHYTLPDTDGIQLHIWDFGGQEIYHATHRLFLSDNALYLLLWSNEPQDQPHEPHYPPTYWLDYIAELSNKNTVLLVPTKHDRYGNYALPDFTELQSIYNEKGLQLHQLNAISALNGTNIRALRAQLSDLAEQRLQQHTEQLPTNWIAVRQRVYEQWIDTKRKIATLADFAALCKGLDISNEATVLGYLSSSGIVFWQADLLRNDIIIDQQYFLDIIYAVFKDRKVKDIGTFTWEDACHIWQSHKDGHIYSDDDRRLFLRFMQSCEIMFVTKTEQGETQYIIPQLLPSTPAHTWLNKQDEKQLRLSYPFLHRNIIERFIVRTAPYAQHAKSWWRNGIYLADEQGNEAYIQAPAPDAQQDQREQAIVVKVCGNNALPLLAKICNEFAQLSRFEQVKQEVSLDAGNTFIDIKHIKQQYQRSERHIYTKENDKVDISPYLAFLDTETTLSSSPSKNTPPQTPKKLNVFISYSHKDITYRNELIARLKPLKRSEAIADIWYDHKITPGTEWDSEIGNHLQTSELIILLISDDFWASDYINDKELPIIKQRHINKDCQVISIILRDNSHWEGSEWEKIQALPTDPKSRKLMPIAKLDNDEAWTLVVKGIRAIIES